MSDINLHIGSPGIFPGATTTIYSSFMQGRADNDARIVSTRAYKKSWEKSVLTGLPEDVERARASRLSGMIASDTDHLHVVDAPDVLSGGQALAEGGRLFPDGPRWLQSLMGLIGEHHVKLILLITDIDRLAKCNRLSDASSLGLVKKPWTDLIIRIHEVVPADTIHVFAANNADRFAFALPHILFDPHVHIEKRYDRAAGKLSRDFVEAAGPEPTGAALQAYQADLETIKGIAHTNLTVI